MPQFIIFGICALRAPKLRYTGAAHLRFAAPLPWKDATGDRRGRGGSSALRLRYAPSSGLQPRRCEAGSLQLGPLRSPRVGTRPRTSSTLAPSPPTAKPRVSAGEGLDSRGARIAGTALSVSPPHFATSESGAMASDSAQARWARSESDRVLRKLGRGGKEGLRCAPPDASATLRRTPPSASDQIVSQLGCAKRTDAEGEAGWPATPSPPMVLPRGRRRPDGRGKEGLRCAPPNPVASRPGAPPGRRRPRGRTGTFRRGGSAPRASFVFGRPLEVHVPGHRSVAEKERCRF